MKKNANKNSAQAMKAAAVTKEVNNGAQQQQRVVKLELFLMLQQLKGARELADTYSREHKPDAWLHLILDKATAKINEVMNDVASVIGWDVLESVEHGIYEK